MLHIIVGHRGTGKTHFLKKLQPYYQRRQISAQFFDLDEEIEKISNQSIIKLFESGEKIFRKWEAKTFKKLTNSIKEHQTCFISVGAGFVFQKKAQWNVISLFRESDQEGRIFFDRPALSQKNPLDEWSQFYKKRSLYYLNQADDHLYKREHFKNLDSFDFLFLNLKKLNKSYFSYRLYPQLLPKNKKNLQTFLNKRLQWGIRFFEVHDQDCSLEFVKKLQNLLPKDKILYSSQKSKKFSGIKNKKYWSWDLSLGAVPKQVNILALHQRGTQPLKSLLKSFSQYKGYHLKLAIEIYNLKELRLAYDWWNTDPHNRSFLPRSPEGRWLWFRQIFGPQMFLHFIKEQSLIFSNYKNQEILDQPFFSQALCYLKKHKALAGLLADPVNTLATPSEQHSFFYQKNSIPVVALPFKEHEMTKKNLQLLKEWGFLFFAVSSPNKKKAYLIADQKDKKSQEFQTSNTLIFHNKKWKAFNTDWNGLSLLKTYNSSQTVVWGGGGTRPVLKKILQKAHFYSARTGKKLNTTTKDLKKDSPKILIWAVGRKRMQQTCLWPPQHWNPQQVIDLNYTKNSPGLEYALKVKAKYQDGSRCFKKQAQQQRKLFKKLYNL